MKHYQTTPLFIQFFNIEGTYERENKKLSNFLYNYCNFKGGPRALKLHVFRKSQQEWPELSTRAFACIAENLCYTTDDIFALLSKAEYQYQKY